VFTNRRGSEDTGLRDARPHGEAPVTNLQRRLKNLESLLTDPSGLIPHSEKWLEYWQRWIDRWSDDPSFRPRERMPLEAARAIIARAPDYDKS
jgi:hypothetical protein